MIADWWVYEIYDRQTDEWVGSGFAYSEESATRKGNEEIALLGERYAIKVSQLKGE